MFAPVASTEGRGCSYVDELCVSKSCGVTSFMEHLLRMSKVLHSQDGMKPDVLAHIYKPSIWEAETRWSEVQYNSLLQMEFQVKQIYKEPDLKI